MQSIKAKVRTVVRRQINKDGPVVVTSPAFRFINTGTVTAFINGFPLLPQAGLGDDSVPFLAAMLNLNPAFKFFREDEFNIIFKFGSGTSQLAAERPALGQTQQSATERQSVYLVETFYDIIK